MPRVFYWVLVTSNLVSMHQNFILPEEKQVFGINQVGCMIRFGTGSHSDKGIVILKAKSPDASQDNLRRGL